MLSPSPFPELEHGPAELEVLLIGLGGALRHRKQLGAPSFDELTVGVCAVDIHAENIDDLRPLVGTLRLEDCRRNSCPERRRLRSALAS